MGSTTLKTVTLDGDGRALIIENTARKEAPLIPMPLYLSDSNLTDVFDFGGVIKTFTLTGTYTGTLAQQISFIDSIEAFLQGHQDTSAGYPITFTDDLRGTKKVKVMDFDSTKVEGQPTRITWTLKLVESSSSA